MRHFNGHQKVEPGLYFNLRKLQFRNMEQGGRLPGSAEDTYRAVPTLAMLVVGPLLGLAFVIFLPLIGFVAAGWLVTRQVVALNRRLRRGHLRAAPRRIGN